jgi:prepilin signal peptidase PulO-like enzyme (type II secretory pathway)
LHDALFFFLAIPLVLYSFLEGPSAITPDELTLGGAALGLVTCGMRIGAGFEQTTPPLGRMTRLDELLNAGSDSLLGILVPFFGLWLAGWLYQRLRHREGLGFGAVKAAAMLGAFMGLQAALVALVGASILLSILGFLYIRATGRDFATYELPFSSFLVAAGVIVTLFQVPISPWYSMVVQTVHPLVH